MAVRVMEFTSGATKLEYFCLGINILKGNYRILRIGLWGGVNKCQNLSFKVNFLNQKLSENFSFFFIEEYQFRSTLFVIDIF